MTPARRFVIFSAARSGTSLVTAALAAHPQIYCHAEIFQARRENHILPEFLAAHDVEALARQPYALAKAVLGWTPGPPVVGFKMWAWQAPRAASQLLADRSVQKILIERENRLAGFSSVRLTDRTGIWNRWAGEGRPEAPPLLDFDPADFDAYVARQKALFDGYRAQLAGEVLEVRYTDLPEPGLGAIQDFLGVERRELPHKRVKLYAADILGRFAPEARPAVLSALDRLGHPEWAHEDA